MSEQEPVIPESYVTDKDKAETMAEAEKSPRETLSRKLNGEEVITDWSGEKKNWSESELRKNIEDRADIAAIRYDAAEKTESGIDNHPEEHPDAVIDPSEAMVIAEATKSREEEISKLKQEAYEIIEKGQSVPGAVVDTIQEKREETDTAAKQASDIYRI